MMTHLETKYEIDETYYFENLDQFEPLTSKIRYQMISYLTTKPKTSAQLARDLGITRPKAHYHLQVLVKQGLAIFVKETLVNSIMEKYYIARARFFSFDHLSQYIANHPEEEEFALKFARLKNSFLIRILEVSREKLLSNEVDNLSQDDFTFDFGCRLTKNQIEEIQNELSRLASRIRAFNEQNLKRQDLDTLPHFRNIFLLVASPSKSILLKDDLDQLSK